MKVIEFCSGYGGATEGMLQAGFDFEACYDIWPVAVEQHLGWHPKVPCKIRDVANVTPDELIDQLVWASLPCQPWSTANIHKDKRGKNHPHYYSLAHFARQVQYAKCAIIENVPGLVWSKEGRAELIELEAECVRLGLTMTVHLIYSHWFNVPQERRRAFIIIGRNLPLILIQPTAIVKPLSSAVTCHDGGENIHSSKKRKLSKTVLAGEAHTRGLNDLKAGAGRTIEQVSALQGVPVPPKTLSKKDQYALVGNCVPPELAKAVSLQVFGPFLVPATVGC